MTCYGIVNIAGEFKDMDASSELKNKWVFLHSSYPPASSVITLLSISSDKHMKSDVYDCSLPATAVHFHI